MIAQWNAPISDRFSSLCARVFSPAAAILESEKTLGTRLSVRIVFCCFIPFHSSVIQTRLSMIGYISLNATGKSIRVAINFIATIPVLLICHVKRNFSGDEFLRTVPKLTKHKETRHVHVVSSLEITEENCTKKT